MNYNYFLPCFVSAAAILAAGGALAQQCVQAPSCAELGYTKSASECSGKTVLYCPFDKTKAYCADDVDCGEKAIVGEIRLWPSATPPAGWKICDGSALDKNTYSALYNVIGTTYGGSGNNFYLPNFKGRVPVGVGQVYGGSTYTYTLAETGGENFVQLSSDQIPDHKHIMPWGEKYTSEYFAPWGSTTMGNRGSGEYDKDNKWYYSSYMVSRASYRKAPTKKGEYWTTSASCASDRTSSCATSYHENRMPFLVINYIIYVGDAGTSGSSDTGTQCKEQGYFALNNLKCLTGFTVEYCPYDNNYGKCVSGGDSSDCIALGFTKNPTCATGVLKMVCPYDSSYAKCAATTIDKDDWINDDLLMRDDNLDLEYTK